MKKISPHTLKVGDIVEQWVHFDHSPQEMKLVGRVIWIHPEKRFYRVKFDQPGGSCTESYRFYGKHSGDSYIPNEANTHQKKTTIAEGRVL